MKKIFMIAAMMVAALTVNAQNEVGQMAIGVQGSYGLHKDYKNIGAGLKFQYNITEHFRAEASGNYFFKKDNVSMWDANVNVAYLFPIGEKVNIYPFVGATVLGAKLDVGGAGFSGSFDSWIKKELGYTQDDIDLLKEYAPDQYNALKKEYNSLKGELGDKSSETKFGFNAGAGIEYFITDNFKVNLEAKYQYVKDFDRPVITLGFAYVF